VTIVFGRSQRISGSIQNALSNEIKSALDGVASLRTLAYEEKRAFFYSVESLKVKEIMVKDVVAVASNIHVDEAVKLMNKKCIGCLLVVDGDETRGIVTQKDLIEKVLEKCRNPKQLKVADVMSRHVVVGDPEMEVHAAANLMFKKKIKKLPIIKEKRIVGLVTLTNIARTVGVDSELMDIVEKLSNMRTI